MFLSEYIIYIISMHISYLYLCNVSLFEIFYSENGCWIMLLWPLSRCGRKTISVGDDATHQVATSPNIVQRYHVELKGKLNRGLHAFCSSIVKLIGVLRNVLWVEQKRFIRERFANSFTLLYPCLLRNCAFCVVVLGRMPSLSNVQVFCLDQWMSTVI